MTRRPVSLPPHPELTRPPPPPPDLLSDLLQTVRLNGAIFFTMDVGTPWPPVRVPHGRALAAALAPRVQNLISYHVVTEGWCWAGLYGSAPVKIERGDVVVFPKGDEYWLNSAPTPPGPPSLPETVPYLQGHMRRELPFRLILGSERQRAGFICGFLGCDDLPFNPLLESLPGLLIVRHDEHHELRGRIDALVQFVLAESTGRQGEETVRMRLSELLFVEVVRHHLASLPSAQTGWLAGLRDEVVGKAIALLHREPAKDWSLASLSKAAGASRTVLSERFSKLIGQPPMQYLTRWRIQLASELLRGPRKVSAVAQEVGYESEAAFSRAFKKVAGVGPAAWRRGEAKRA